MQGKDTNKTAFDQLFEAIYCKKFRTLLKKLEVDKYVKKLTALKFIILIAFAQFEQLSRLREISVSLYNKKLGQALKLNLSVSRKSPGSYVPSALKQLLPSKADKSENGMPRVIT